MMLCIYHHRRKQLTAHIFTITQHQRVSAHYRAKLDHLDKAVQSLWQSVCSFESSAKDMKRTNATELNQGYLEYCIHVGKWWGADSKRSIVFARLRILNLIP